MDKYYSGGDQGNLRPLLHFSLGEKRTVRSPALQCRQSPERSDGEAQAREFLGLGRNFAPTHVFINTSVIRVLVQKCTGGYPREPDIFNALFGLIRARRFMLHGVRNLNRWKNVMAEKFLALVQSPIVMELFLASLVIPLLVFGLTSRYEQKKVSFENKKVLLSALNTEVILMTPWAEPAYRDATFNSYQENNEHFDWYHPSRHLFSFNHDVIDGVLSNPSAVNLDRKLVDTLVQLAQSIRTIYERQENLKQYVYAYPDIYEEAVDFLREIKKQFPKIDQEPGAKYYQEMASRLTDTRLRNYLGTIYLMNYQIYVCGIGGDGPKEVTQCIKEPGLHNLWLEAKKLIADELEKLPGQKPHWFKEILLHPIFILTVVGGLVFLVLTRVGLNLK